MSGVRRCQTNNIVENWGQFVDKKELLSIKLSKIMLDFNNQIKKIVSQHPDPEVEQKPDGSPVTKLDLALSSLLEQMGHEKFPSACVYSEENFSEFNFPLLAIDPLDGTKEYIHQRPEWAISIGFFPQNNWYGEGWIFNPITNEVFDDQIDSRQFLQKTKYTGEVSHSEWEKGLYKNIKSDIFQISPKGSIAYKLGRLVAGQSDFVVSLTPKNIWDIAGGTLLCNKNGINFYSEGKKVTEVKQIYHPPLIWCFSDLSEELLSIFCSPDTHP